MGTAEIEKLIANDEKKLDGLLAKKASIEDKISDLKATIEKNNLLLRGARFELISEAAADAGLSVDDIVNALKAGRLPEPLNIISGGDATAGFIAGNDAGNTEFN